MTTDSQLEQSLKAMGEAAQKASHVLVIASSDQKQKALKAICQHIRAQSPQIEAANRLDMQAGQEKGLKASFLDRLLLTPDRIEAMAQAVSDIGDLPDPIGAVLDEWQRPSGLSFQKVAVPLGVIGVIYESRPNVTADAAALCLKAGNATILRGGSDSFNSAGAIMQAITAGLRDAGLPEQAVQRIETRDRAAVGHLLRMNAYVDVIVPRGGKGLIERIQQESRIPVFSHLDGLCHTYVDVSADLDKARNVAFNAKMRRTGICGAMETLLVHQDLAERFLPDYMRDLAAAGCEIRGDAQVLALAKAAGVVAVAAQDLDWDTEYLDPILSIKVVTSLDQAIDHINQHGSSHTEAILAEDPQALQVFSKRVDAGIVMLNASTQFADGGEFGFGGEIGISTGKMHARGPVGAAHLTSYKYLVKGDGTTRP